MSLQVWLPLNGNLNNQGLDGSLEFTNTASATVATDGKIGSCYSFSATSGNGLLLSKGKSVSEFMDTYINHHSWSMCAWVRTTSNDNVVFGLTYGLRLWCGSTNLVNMYNNTRSVSAFNNISIIDGKWHHICATYNTLDNAVNVYVDGIKGTTSYYPSGETYASSWANSVAIGRDPNNSIASSHYYFQGSMNDVRIYDHCLSAKEVKEISKGLICHYKLDNNGFGNPNLCPLINKQEWTAVGTNAYYITLASSTSNFGLSVGDTFTWSMYVKVPTEIKTLRARVQFYNSDSDRPNFYGTSITNGEGKVFVTGTVPSGYSRMELLIDYNASSDILNTNVVCYYKMPKLEKGSVVTPWCPHTSDSLYTSLGLDSITELDCSGYNNDGVREGDVLPSESGGRYSTSTYCNSANVGADTPTGAAYIRCTLTSPIKDATALTVNWWGNVEEYGYQTSGVLSLSNISSLPDDYETSALAQYDFKFRFNLTDGSYSSINSEALIERGNWHMYTLVFNNGAVQGYRDGVPVVSSSKSGTLAQFAYVYMGINAAGRAARKTKSKWSDFRIYSTALSASDIKELYNTSASIDKNGNMYAYEFKEE